MDNFDFSVQLDTKQPESAYSKQQTIDRIPTVVFHNPDRISAKNKQHIPKSDLPTASSSPGITLDLKKARYEIMRMSAKETKDVDAETAIAISLGARPEKRRAVNYKDLMVERKKNKAQAQDVPPPPKKKKPATKRKDKQISKSSKTKNKMN